MHRERGNLGDTIVQVDEKTLVQRAQSRDEAAFAQLYEAYFNKIYRYIALKIGDRTEAEDITQQVFLKALKSINGYRWTGAPFSAWLYRIAHNQIIDFIRKNKNNTVPLDEDLPWRADDDPQRGLEKKMTTLEMIKATKKLTEAQREVISLRFAGELSISEVAKTMGKSEGAVKALQHSAIIALRKILNPVTQNG